MDNNTAIKCTAAVIRAMAMLAQCSLPEIRQSGYTYSTNDFNEIAMGLEYELTKEEPTNV
jgi:hypothetical protein